jgi:YD repeat-containing protein
MCCTSDYDHPCCNLAFSCGELVSIGDFEGNTTTMTYDSSGNMLTSTRIRTEPDPDAQDTTTFSYGDSADLGDVTSITNPLGQETEFVYNQW